MSNDDQSNNPNQPAAKSRPVVRLAKDEGLTEAPAEGNAPDAEPKAPQLPSWLQKGSVDPQPEPEIVSEPDPVVDVQEEPAAGDTSEES